MLKAIHPLLTPELLFVLASMGHGDEIVIADANFPSHAYAQTTVYGDAIFLNGVGTKAVGEAILAHMPLDSFVDNPVGRIEVVGDPAAVPAVQQEFQAVVDAALGRTLPMSGIERFAFYDRAKQAFAIVATGEPRGYGDFILKKGVILSDA